MRSRRPEPAAGDRRRKGLRAGRVREPCGVLAGVVLAVLAGLDLLPPVPVVAIPGDRRGEAIGERRLRTPAEPAQLPGVERVAAIVAGAVVDAGEQGGVRAGQL